MLSTIALFRRLPSSDHEELQEVTDTLLKRKNFEGHGGFRLSTDKKLMVAVQAAILLLHRPSRKQTYYPSVDSILIYPTAFMAPATTITEPDMEVREGESWSMGTIILAWDSVVAGAQAKDRGTNLVLHEFAHSLDDEHRPMDRSRILFREFQNLCQAVERNEKTVLDPYGAEDPSEFFAVATEMFFMTPRKILKHHPKLYAELQAFYRQDPASWG